MGEINKNTKHEERKERILDATATLIVRFGYDKTAVSDIAKDAGISKGAIYLHFDSKDDLLQQLMLREILKFLEMWSHRMQSDTSIQVFSSMYRHVLTLMKESDFIWTLFANPRWLLGTELINRENSTLYQRRLGLSNTMLTKLQEVGAIRQDINPETTAYVFNMLNYGFLRLGDVIPENIAPPADEVVQEIGDLVQRHLEPDSSGNLEAARIIILEFLSGAIQLVKQMYEINSS